MKTFSLAVFTLFLPAFCIQVHAQQNVKVIYDFSDPGADYRLDPLTVDWQTVGDITLELTGPFQTGCKITLGPAEFPCNTLKGRNNQIIISKDGTVRNTGFSITRPFEIRVENASKGFRKLEVPENGSSVTNTSSNPVAVQEQKELDGYNICTKYGPAVPWSDALDLEQAIDDVNLPLIRVILCKYYFPDSTCKGCLQKSYADVYKEVSLDKNKFLLQVLPDTSTPEPEAIKKFGGSSGLVKSEAGDSQSAILNPTVALDALGTFIANRLVDELNMAYLNKFRETLNDSAKFKDFGILLPQTKKFLTTFGENSMIDYKNLLTGLRQNFFADLTELPENLPTLVKNKEGGFKNKELYISTLAFLEIVNNVNRSADPPEIISRVGAYDYKLPARTVSNVQTMLRLTALISNHLRQNDPHGPWIDKMKSFQSHRAAYLFAGLVFKKDRDFFQQDSLKFRAGSPQSLENYIRNDDSGTFIESLYRVLALISELHAISQKEIKSDQAIEKTLEMSERILNVVASCNRTAISIASRNRTAISTADYDEAVKLLHNLLALKQHIHQKEFVAAGTSVVSMFGNLGINIDSTKEFFRYLSFAQNLIDAKTKEELIAALEQAADPVGNYRLKRQHPLTVSITSYPGLYLGREEYCPEINNHTIVNNIGFTAPLGLALSLSAGNSLDAENAKPKTSFTVFVPLIDVGAITALRLVDKDAELQEVAWKNFIAPGLFFNVGFKNSLLSLHFGAQLGPEIQKLGTDTRPRLWRFGLGFSADLHLWSIYTKAKR